MKPISPAVIYRAISRWFHPDRPPAVPAMGSGKADSAVSAPVLDVDAAMARLMGDLPLYHQLLDIFIQTYSTAGEKLRAALPERVAEATRIVHTLKGAAATIGAEQLTAAAASLEKALAGGAARSVAVQLLALESSLCATLVAAERFCTDCPMS